MVTKANRQRRKPKDSKPRGIAKGFGISVEETHAAIDRAAKIVFDRQIPASLLKTPAEIQREAMTNICLDCGQAKSLCQCNQGRGKALNDPLGDLCGEPWHPIAIYAISASIAFCGGLGMGWLVWA